MRKKIKDFQQRLIHIVLGTYNFIADKILASYSIIKEKKLRLCVFQQKPLNLQTKKLLQFLLHFFRRHLPFLIIHQILMLIKKYPQRINRLIFIL